LHAKFLKQFPALSFERKFKMAAIAILNSIYASRGLHTLGHLSAKQTRLKYLYHLPDMGLSFFQDSGQDGDQQM